MKNPKPPTWSEQIYDLVAIARIPNPFDTDEYLSLFDYSIEKGKDEEGIILSDKLISLFSSELERERKEFEKMIPKKLTLTKEETNNDWFYGLGYNHAIRELRDTLRKGKV